MKWKWIEGVVDKNKDHIKITYGDVRKDETMIPIAHIAPGEGRSFNVQFINKKDDLGNKMTSILKEVKEELNFYLVNKGEPDPWAYAQYHCTTAANMYSNVHWEWIPKRRKPKVHT